MLSDTSCTVSTIRAIRVPFHGILYCYGIPRYIVTLAADSYITQLFDLHFSYDRWFCYRLDWARINVPLDIF